MERPIGNLASPNHEVSDAQPDTEPATQAVPDNTALVHAVVAAERAVRAGVDHAVAVAALAAMRAEIVSTRRQLRAVRDRWTPRLEAAHRAVTIALDDQEHDEGVRLRWAADPTRRRAIR